MKIITKNEVKHFVGDIIRDINAGKIFIYPTDTIYGIGCDAFDSKAVKKLRALKQRGQVPFSVIAPSKNWIYQHCEVTDEIKQWIEEKLPGPYTLILKKKTQPVSEEVNLNRDTIGVRIPNHWISGLVSRLGKPIVTTGVNISGTTFMTKIENLHPDLKPGIYFAILEGELKGHPSKIVHFDTGMAEVLKRYDKKE